MILALSILIRLVAMVWAIFLLRRMRDWRYAVFVATLGLMALRQILTLSRLVGQQQWSLSFSAISMVELPGLAVSVLAALAVFFLDWIIRDHRKALADLREREGAIVQSQKMDALGQLAGRTAHDFNNLLAIIIGNAELAKTKLPEGHEAAENLRELETAALRGAELSGQILSFSRKQVVEQRVFDVNKLILGLDSMLRPLLGSDIEYVTLMESQDALVYADPNQLSTSLINLAVNSRDAMPQGGTLTVKTAIKLPRDGATRSPATPLVTITVEDTGEGMSDAARSCAFDPFYTTKPQGKGTGLGLSICLGIIERAGGAIQIVESSSEGTVICIELPQAEGVESPLSDAVPSTASAMRGSELVLIVEDEQQLRRLEVDALTSRGYEVLQAANGVEALQILEGSERVPDLVVTDVVMPLMGGSELAKKLRSQHPSLPILFTSGYMQAAESSDEIQGDGEIRFLQKPYNASQFSARVRGILDKARVSKQSAALS